MAPPIPSSTADGPLMNNPSIPTQQLKKDLKIQGAEWNQEIEKDMENHNKSGRENYLEENSPPSSEFEFVDKNNSSPEPQPSGLQHPLSLENTVSCSPLSFQVKK